VHVAIIGNGIAGITAARELRKLRPDWRITVVSGESDHHYSRPALMYVFMGHMRYEHTKPYEDGFWAKNRIDLVRAWVTRIDVKRKVLAHQQSRQVLQ
jgi:NADPH-dependent 2,4-dienoyl-CoA reductase/sulfur reductase-like enzyme